MGKTRTVQNVSTVTQREIRSVGAGEFEVPSESNNEVVYVVSLGEESSCTCADHQFRKHTCKHIRACRLHSYRLALAAARELSLPVLQRHARRTDLRAEVVLAIELTLQASEFEAEAVRKAA